VAKSKHEKCYLCGNALSEPINRDHVPPRRFFAPEIRKKFTVTELITLALRPDAFSDDCARAAVIVTSKQAPGDCKALVIDAEKLQKTGAMGLRWTGAGFVTEAIRPRGLDRPWSPAIPDTPEPETGAGRPTISRPVDVTPAEADVQGDEQ
jgi:competence protein ComEC